MFLKTMTITERVMGTATDKSKNGQTEKDNIGKTGSRNYTEAVLETVKHHIKKIPSDGISLYARNKQTSIFSI